MGGTAWGKGPHCAHTLGYWHQQDTFILELEEQYVQRGSLPTRRHPDPFLAAPTVPQPHQSWTQACRW